MAAWSSSLDFGAHPVVEYCYSSHTIGVRLRVETMIRVRVRVSVRIRVRVSVRVQSGRCTRSGGRVVDYELQFLQ